MAHPNEGAQIPGGSVKQPEQYLKTSELLSKPMGHNESTKCCGQRQQDRHQRPSLTNVHSPFPPISSTVPQIRLQFGALPRRLQPSTSAAAQQHENCPQVDAAPLPIPEPRIQTLLPTSEPDSPQPLPGMPSTPHSQSLQSNGEGPLFSKVPISKSPLASPQKRLDLSTVHSVARQRPDDLLGEVFVLVESPRTTQPTLRRTSDATEGIKVDIRDTVSEVTVVDSDPKADSPVEVSGPPEVEIPADVSFADEDVPRRFEGTVIEPDYEELAMELDFPADVSLVDEDWPGPFKDFINGPEYDEQAMDLDFPVETPGATKSDIPVDTSLADDADAGGLEDGAKSAASDQQIDGQSRPVPWAGWSITPRPSTQASTSPAGAPPQHSTSPLFFENSASPPSTPPSISEPSIQLTSIRHAGRTTYSRRRTLARAEPSSPFISPESVMGEMDFSEHGVEEQDQSIGVLGPSSPPVNRRSSSPELPVSPVTASQPSSSRVTRRLTSSQSNGSAPSTVAPNLLKQSSTASRNTTSRPRPSTLRHQVDLSSKPPPTKANAVASASPRRRIVDRVQVIIPISPQRRETLIARGVFDPVRDGADADPVANPTEKRSKPQPATKNAMERRKEARVKIRSPAVEETAEVEFDSSSDEDYMEPASKKRKSASSSAAPTPTQSKRRRQSKVTASVNGKPAAPIAKSTLPGTRGDKSKTSSTENTKTHAPTATPSNARSTNVETASTKATANQSTSTKSTDVTPRRLKLVKTVTPPVQPTSTRSPRKQVASTQSKRSPQKRGPGKSVTTASPHRSKRTGDIDTVPMLVDGNEGQYDNSFEDELNVLELLHSDSDSDSDSGEDDDIRVPTVSPVASRQTASPQTPRRRLLKRIPYIDIVRMPRRRP